MILIDKMVIAALRLRAKSPWTYFEDSEIFAVKLSDGEIGYCCIMGFGGEHYALGFYRGTKGFATYLKTLSMADGRLSEEEIFELCQTFDCINCEFVNASDSELSKESKAIIKKVAAASGIKMCRPNGWPVFIRMNHGVNLVGLDSEKDVSDITLALEASVDMVERVERSDADMLEIDTQNPVRMNYAPVAGGKIIPLLIPVEGGSGVTFELSQTKTPPLCKDEYPAVKFKDSKLCAKMKSMKKDGVMQCRVIHLRMPVGNKAKSYFPQILLVVDKKTGTVFPLMPASMEDADDQMVSHFAGSLCDSDSIPMAIEVMDEHTEQLLHDFCRRTGIMLLRVKELPELTDAWSYMNKFFSV